MQAVCLGLLINYANFIVCFDNERREPIYVQYKQETVGSCSPRPSFKQEPKGAYTNNDYTNTGYDRGHLVPNADYGCETFIMGNVVPQLPEFNRGPWKNMEKDLRDKYRGKTILKGGKYGEKKMANGIAIPDGFYWLVLNGDILIENGYIDQTTLVQSKELPSWYKREISYNMNMIIFGAVFFVTVGIFAGYIVYANCKDNEKDNIIVLSHVDSESNDV